MVKVAKRDVRGFCEAISHVRIAHLEYNGEDVAADPGKEESHVVVGVGRHRGLSYTLHRWHLAFALVRTWIAFGRPTDKASLSNICAVYRVSTQAFCLGEGANLSWN